MIKKLSEINKEKLLDYLKLDPEANLFPISDIEKIGINESLQSIWADENNDGHYQSVLYEGGGTIIVYIYDTFRYNFKGLGDVLIEMLNTDRISYLLAKKDTMDLIMPLINKPVERRNRFMCRCDEVSKDYKPLHIDKIKYADVSDVPAIAQMLGKIDEFPVPMNVHITEHFLKMGYIKIIYIQDNMKDKPENEIMSVGQIYAETDDGGLIASVATLKEYRQMGYASDIVYLLTKNLNEKGKFACLTYDNPEAGNIYKRLGYKELFKYDKLIFD